VTRAYANTVAFLASIRGNRLRFLAVSSVASTALIVTTAFGGGHSDGLLAALKAAATAPVAAVTPSSSTPAPTPSAGNSGGAVKSSTAGSFTPTPVSNSDGGDDDETTTPAATTPTLGRVKHVFVVSLASPGYDNSFGATPQMPYLSSLRAQGELLENYSLLSSAGLPNYIAMTSGQPPNAATATECATATDYPPAAKPGSDGVVAGDGCVYPIALPSVADQVGSARLKWHAYLEDMAKTCDHPVPGSADPTATATSGYVTRHNPFAYYHVLLETGDCSTNDVPLTSLTGDLAKASATSNYSFISPNLCHGGWEIPCATGDAGGAATSDAWLQTIIPQIMNSPAYKADGLIVVTFGQVATKAGDPAPPENARVGTLLISKFLKAGGTRTEAFDPYALLRSTQEILSLDKLGKAKAAGPTFAPEVLGPAKKAKKKSKKRR
jgi:hypothetical protein